MKRLILILYLLIFTTIGTAQTTFFHNSGYTNSNSGECARLYSVELKENGVVVTIEVKAVKALRRLKIWSTHNTSIKSGNNRILGLKGLIVGNEVKPCGPDQNWGWDNVAVGTVNRYQLFFGGPNLGGALPPGITNISIVDDGDSYGRHGYCFRNYTINNPRKHYTSFVNESTAKQNIDANNDGICGIYEQIGSNNYKLACIKENGNYKLVYLSSSNNFGRWSAGDIKAYLNKSASGIFKAEWFMANKSVNKDTYIVFDGLSMTVTQTSGTDPGEKKYLKMYPEESSNISENSQSGQWTGTGFALTNGYIITNNHVVNGAKSIVVLGVNGNFNTEFKANVIAVDKNNDLALIKIDDYRFNGFSTIPYAIKNTLCEVGEDVFVLGYPMINYMGDEVKLTNGIISSRSGYQGDITTYQISAPLQPGNSGGPMFDSKGNIVGIVNAGIPGAENVGYAIKTSYLFNLVASSTSTSIIPQTNRVTGVSLADKVRSVKKYVFLIKCKGN